MSPQPHESKSVEDAMGEQIYAMNVSILRLEAENERLRALFRKLYDALPPSSAFDNLAREIKREMR